MGIAPLPDRLVPRDAGTGHPGLDLVVDHTAPASRRGVRGLAEPPGRVDLRGKVDGVSALLGGGANVVLQLAWREVGRGVVESKVETGQVTRHPFKRARTTLTYIAVAMYGSDELRRDYRRAVDSVHVHVRSDEDSPVRYNAFNRELQLWVASCLYYGARDTATRLHGGLDDETEAAWFRAGRRFGTTLQVPEEMWHADLDAFEAYWEEGLARAEFDDETRSYVLSVLEAGMLPFPLRLLMRPGIKFFNVGFLPEQLRETLDLEWSPRQERAHRLLMRAMGLATRPLPDAVRALPFHLLIADVSVRRRLGRPLI